MNLRTFLAIGVSALFGLCLAAMFVGSTAAQRPQSGRDRTDLINDVWAERPVAPAVIGRYQGTADSGSLFLFDTTTGACWQALPGEKWKKSVAPIPAVQP
jgi:hypothetical protein